MTLFYSQDFDMSFATVPGLQANGMVVTGSANPAGIPGRIDIINNVFRSTIVDTDPPTATGIRAECVFAAATLGVEEWFTFEMRIDEKGWNDNGTISICQVHPKDTIVSAVPVMIVVKFGGWQVWTPAEDPPIEQLGFQRALYPFAFNRWNRVAIHAKWANTPTGFMEVFINDIPIHRRFDLGTAYAADTPYFKLGVYDAPHLLGFGTKTAYYRNLKIYRGLETQALVIGRTPRPRRRLTA